MPADRQIKTAMRFGPRLPSGLVFVVDATGEEWIRCLKGRRDISFTLHLFCVEEED